MVQLKILPSLLILALLAGCGFLPSLDEVLPDQRTAYKGARDMPPLEVPPDLSADSISDTMAIPGEGEANTLSAYERQQQAGDGAQLGGALANEQTLRVRGDRLEIWPQLQNFWRELGYEMELDDAELGVLETAWSQPRETGTGEVRERFKVFAEPGNEAQTTLLFISQDRQQRDGGAQEWRDAGSDADRRQQVASELSEFLGGSDAQVAATSPTAATDSAGTAARRSSSLPRAEIINNDQGQVYMSLPDSYDSAWQMTENAMARAGMQIRSADADSGEYVVAFMPDDGGDKGWFESLKFWSSDEPAVYRVNLTPADDNRTELVLRDDSGEWLSGDAARDVLNRIQRQYNR